MQKAYILIRAVATVISLLMRKLLNLKFSRVQVDVSIQLRVLRLNR